MATLHLPKKRPFRENETFEDKVERALDKGLKQTFPASDPVAVVTPGGPVSPDEFPTGKKPDQKPLLQAAKSARPAPRARRQNARRIRQAGARRFY